MTTFAISPGSLSFHGSGLKRPECVLSHSSGLLFAADWTPPGGVSILDPRTGRMVRHLARDPSAGLKPNGIFLEDDASFLLAHLGDADGGVFRLGPDGTVEPVLTEVDGASFPPTNFACRDARGRLYVTVSTRHLPRHLASNPTTADGFVVMAAPGEPARIVADGLGYTNECALDPNGARLVLNETYGRRTTAFAIASDGTLGPGEVLASYGEGIFPDGLTFDEEGALWITSIVSNTLLRLMPGGELRTILQDRHADAVREVEARYLEGTLDRTLLDRPHEGMLQNISSLAFGGENLETAYLGCLLGDRIASFPSPVRGARPAHYEVDLAPLAAANLLP